MVLREMQRLLARLYDVPLEYDVCDFLVTDRRDMQALMSDSQDSLTDEQVLVAHGADGLRLSVYIDDQVLQRLATQNPWQMLHSGNLQDYCTALEGVSHFHYLAWSATRERAVSLLELEVQAELDKYASALLLLSAQMEGRFPSELHAMLFHRVAYARGLDASTLQRYQEANRQAARFCRVLEERFLRTRRVRVEAWLQELRRIYRCSHREKLRSLVLA